MKTNFGRRDLLKTIGATAALGSTACQLEEPESAVAAGAVVPRVNLICHGMMLLWQDRAAPRKKITIYLPDTGGKHVVRMSTVVKGVPNYLVKNDGTELTGHYSLDLTGKPPDNSNKPMNAAQDVVLHNEPSLAVVTGKTLYQIDVWYPTFVRRARLLKYPFWKSHPYTPGYTQKDFDIKPGEMAGVHILTYDNVSTGVTLTKPEGDPKVLFATKDDLPPYLNIHLYSQATAMSQNDHLQHFNNMLEYTDGGTKHPKLDLLVTPNNPPDLTPKEKEKVDYDYSALDVYDLWEITELRGQYDAAAKEKHRVVDPAGCFQGWGS